MKLFQKYILLIFLLFALIGYSQEVKKDSIIYKDVYGFRVGIDVSNPARTFFDSDRKSLELVADYRINKKIYAAVELGFLDKTTNEDYINFNTNGQYIKVGANYNLYENWLDMDNEVYIGLRYGFSTFKQTLNSYTVYSDVALPSIQNNTRKEFTGLTANWGELVFGMKVETFKNVFVGASFSFKKMISTTEPENFKNLYVPGFDRVFLNNGGFGFNYTIAYRLPLYKKNKAVAEEDKEL
jgi:predicted porin